MRLHLYQWFAVGLSAVALLGLLEAKRFGSEGWGVASALLLGLAAYVFLKYSILFYIPYDAKRDSLRAIEEEKLRRAQISAPGQEPWRTYAKATFEDEDSKSK